MTFDLDKNNILSKQDKSKIGSIDPHIMDLCSLINDSENYYTTSSCAGRTVLIQISESGKKNESKWLYVEHELPEKNKIDQILRSSAEGEVWFRYEPFIIHIACKTPDHAENIVKIARQLGFKRSGMISLGTKNTVEILGTENIATPLTKDSKLLVDEEFIQTLIALSTDKQKKNWDNIEKLETELRSNI